MPQTNHTCVYSKKPHSRDSLRSPAEIDHRDSPVCTVLTHYRCLQASESQAVHSSIKKAPASADKAIQETAHTNQASVCAWHICSMRQANRLSIHAPAHEDTAFGVASAPALAVTAVNAVSAAAAPSDAGRTAAPSNSRDCPWPSAAATCASLLCLCWR
jgi:hypothetical protein